MSNAGPFIAKFSSNPPYVFPDGDIYVDNCSWLDISSGRPYGQATENYLYGFTGQNTNPYILWSPHNSAEFIESLVVDEYTKEAKNRGITGKRPDKVLERQISASEKVALNEAALKRHDDMLAKFKDSIYPVDQLDVENTTREIMLLYGVLYKDAKHLAYMWHEEINNIVTTDPGYATVPGLNIYTPNMNSSGGQPFPFSAFMPKLKK